MSKAYKLFFSDGVAHAVHSKVLAELNRLQSPAPPSSVDPHADARLFVDSRGDPVDFDDHAALAIRAFPPGSGLGLSGFPPTGGAELIERDCASAFFLPFGEFVGHCLLGKLHLAVVDFFCSANSIPLDASLHEKCTIRSLGCGEFFRRGICKVFFGVENIQTEYASMRPFQCGVGVKIVCQRFTMGLQELVRHLPQDGDWIVVQTGFENAFNMLHRNAIVSGTTSIFPSSYILIHNCYGQHPPFFCPGGGLPSSQRRSHQGDPVR